MTQKLNWFDNVENRPHPWPGLNWLTTGLSVPDVRRAVDFYTGAMDMVAIAELPDTTNDSGELLFARLRYRGNNFTLNKEHWDSACLSPASSGQTPPFIFYLYVDDVAALTEQMVQAGASVQVAASEMFWGDKKARLQDPFGYLWDIAQKL